MLFSRYQVADEKKRQILRHVASLAKLKQSFCAEINKVENHEDLCHGALLWTHFLHDIFARAGVRIGETIDL